MRLLGRSILFSDTNAEWKKRRTAFAPAFYKGKLVKMVEIAKESVRTTINRWKKLNNGEPGKQFAIMDEMQIMSSRILLNCALGEDISERTIPFRRNGKVTEMNISKAMLITFEDCLGRMASPHTLFFPILRDIYILPYEREIEANCREIRKLVEEIIRNRRDACLKDPSMKLRGDFLQILLDDETTSGDEQLIVDECLTFFFAGSQTSNLSSTNLIYMLVKHPEYRKNILKELEKVVVQPYLQANLSKVDSFDILDLMDFENTGDL